MHENAARRAHTLLAQALDLDPAQREAFLRKVCGEDAELRPQLTALLAAAHESDHFLETPALPRTRGGLGRTPFKIHQTIEGYRIVRVIGVGGMAAVYEAMQKEPSRRVALKVMRQGLGHPTAVQRFRFETEILARIQHPGIVQIFEAGAWDDGSGVSTPYFAMEYIADALPFTRYANQNSLSLHDRLRMFVEVCDAVQHGHQHGVIHRDLKPGNVLVDAAGRAKVIDFGIARSADPGQTLSTRATTVGQIIGTLNYMSPEQCSANSDVDIRCDVYALGVILYELVCGKLPHDLSSVPIPEAIRIVCEDQPARPGALNPALRGDIDAIVMTAMDKDAHRRYPTVAALAADIRRFLSDEIIEARPPTLVHQCRLFVRRNRGLVAASIVVAAVVLIGGVASAYLAYQRTLEADRRLIAETRAIEERDEARWQAYVANIAGGFAALTTSEFQQLRTRLSRADARHRDWEWRFLSGMAQRSERVIEAHDDMIFGFAISPDRSKLASCSRDGSIRVWNAESGERVAEMLDTPDQPCYALAFHRDGMGLVSGSGDGSVRLWDSSTGRQLRLIAQHTARIDSVSCGIGDAVAAVSLDGAANIWNAATGEVIHDFSRPGEKFYGIVFSDDGDRLAAWTNRGELTILKPADGAILHRMTFPGTVSCGGWSADGEHIALGGSEGRTVLWSTRTGEKLRELAIPNNVSTVRTLIFSPQGDMIATGQINRGINLWAVETGQRLGVLWGHEEAVSGLHFSADGLMIHSASWDRTMRLWAMGVQATSGVVPILRGHEDRILAVAFSPDGSTLASGSSDDTIRFWDPEENRSLGVLQSSLGAVSALAFSPDGCMFASGGADGVVRLWESGSAELLAKLTGHTEPVLAVAFSSDGRRLASGGDDNTVRTWDLDSLLPLSVMEGHSQRVWRVAFTPDGRRLISVSRDETARIWNAETGGQLHLLEGHESDVFALVISRDGRRIFTGSRDQSVRVWDAHSGDCLHTLRGHGQFVTSLSLSPDERRLAASSWFGEILIWDADKYEIVASFKANDQAVRTIAFSPDGRWLAAGCNDKNIRLFDSADQEFRREARKKAVSARKIADARIADLSAQGLSDAQIRDLILADPAFDQEIQRQATQLLLTRALKAHSPN